MRKLLPLLFMTFTALTLFFLDPNLAASTNANAIFDLHEEEDLIRGVRFNELKASGSGQFSERGFIAWIHSLPIESEKLIIVDLREECHGFVNGIAVSWKNEFYNHSIRTSEDIEEEENEQLRSVLNVGHVGIQEGKEQTNLLDVAISQALTEREYVESFGHHYVRIPVADGERPNDLFVDRFVELIRDSSSVQWIHFHCRTGKRKTATFLLLLDIIKNSREVSLEAILANHQQIYGIHREKFGSEEERLCHPHQRLDFISEFYTYCQEVSDFSTPWSEWISQRSITDNIQLNEAAHFKSLNNPLPMQKREKTSGKSLKRKERGKSYRKLKTSGNKRLYSLRALSSPLYDIVNEFSNISVNKPSYEGRIEISNDSQGWQFGISGKGKVSDGKGNYAEADLKHGNNGPGTAGISVGNNGKRK